MADAPNIIEQQPAGGGVNKPDGGTYGEGAALERLRTALPGMDAAAPGAPVTPPGTPGPGPQAPTPGPPGLPSFLMEPTRSPGVAPTTPLQQTPQVASDRRAQSIQMLEALTKSPTVTDETREWAAMTLNKIIRTARA